MHAIVTPPTPQRPQPIELEALPVAGPLHRLGGGYETDVYRTADQRYVVKLKRTGYRSAAVARAQARVLRAIAEHFAACLGPAYSLPTAFVVTGDPTGAAQVVLIQPFLKDARPLYTVDYQALPHAERQQIMAQLRAIICRAQACYRATGVVPDLYGVSGATPAELARMRAPYMMPVHFWNFFTTRTLLRSHNLLLTPAPEQRVVLVDYDLAMQHRPHLFRRIYFASRALLFWRDRLMIRLHGRAWPFRRWGPR